MHFVVWHSIETDKKEAIHTGNTSKLLLEVRR